MEQDDETETIDVFYNDLKNIYKEKGNNLEENSKEYTLFDDI